MTEIYVDGSADNFAKERESYTSVWVPGYPGIIKVCPATTNNEAEYFAVIEGIRTAELLKLNGPVTIVSDSQLVVNQLKGEWRCKEPRLQELLDRALNEIERRTVSSFTFRWVRREFNQAGIELDKFAKSLKLRTLDEIKGDLRDVRTEIARGATPERQKELVDKLRVLRVEQVQAERTAEKGGDDG